jgi:hypothetical protein
MAPAVNKKPSVNNVPPLAKPCIYITAETVNVNKAKLVKIGHGEGSTKWNGNTW